MQPDSVSHVIAKFGGRRLRFELPRRHDVITNLEKELGSVSAAWGRFKAGDWTMTDVAAILAAAHPPVPAPLEEPRLSHQLAMVAGGALPKPTTRPVTLQEIWPVMSRRAMATYAPLAAAVLTAAFIGLPAKSAVFDEDAPLIEEPGGGA